MKRIKYAFCLYLSLLYIGEAVSQNPDIWLSERINGWNSQEVRQFSRAMTNSEIAVALSIPAGIAIYGLYSGEKKYLNDAVVICASIAGSYALTQAFKLMIDRKRPYEKYPDRIVCRDPSSSSSFPSTHTSTAFALATSLSLQYPRWYVIAPSMLWASAVGFARINQGVHYPSDVLGGMILGAGTAYLSYRINKWRLKKRTFKMPYSVQVVYPY
ncbi:MAG: phosphatase PAP2 family protein [Bacteroidaceae bacterium]|nr:phosphatase PAP2 family protein [Bacteroidaceae bacterium]